MVGGRRNKPDLRKSAMSQQFDLLGDPLPTPAPARVKAKPALAEDTAPQAADIPAAQCALAEKIPKAIRLGTSTWSFPGWAGIVYGMTKTAPQVLSRKGLSAYSKHPLLRTVGIDRTFYAPILREEFERYAAQVPDDFSFLCKAPNAVTSPFIQGGAGYTTQVNPTFLDVELAMKAFVAPASEGLGNKAGPLVFQFSPLGKPATQTPDEMVARLLGFLRNVRAHAGNDAQLAVEVRNEQLLTPGFDTGLSEIGVRYCVGVHPRMPSAAAQLQAMASAVKLGLVVRWSLNPHTGADYEGAKEQYAPFDKLVDEDPGTRATLAHAAVEAVKRGEKVHMVANNKAEGSSPLSMFKLAAAIAALIENDEEIVL
jgi:uncharacterized protein YecE (DUF72 family)